MAKIKIAIDAGHGSKTNGKRTPPFTADVDINGDGRIDIKKGTSYREHYAAVGVANRLYYILKARGYDLIKTGWDDSNAKDDPDTPLSTRQREIKKAKCDYSISIHFNAFGDGKSFNSANGVSVYIHSKYPGDSKKFAEYVLQELIKGSPQKNRGVHSAKLAMCNCKTMATKASILCELAFMTNQHEAMELMADEDFWEESAYEIANAVDRYTNRSSSSKPVPSDNTKKYHTVAAGETLSEIAKRYDMNTVRIAELNHLENPDLIYVGQKLLISDATT